MNISIYHIGSMSDITAPAIWGPSAWYLIHHIMKNLVKLNPQGNHKIVYQNAVEDFLIALLTLIPCGICQSHFQENLIQDPAYLYFDDWEKLDQWSYNLHNKVNKIVNKPILPYTEYINMYQRKQNKQLIEFPKIIYDLHVEPHMSLSEIQDIKTFLNALVVLYPSDGKTDTIQKNKKIIKEIYDYNGLNDFYQQFIRYNRFI